MIRVAAVLLVLTSLAAAGCASEQHRRDEEQARQAQREALRTRGVATVLAATLSAEADALQDARKARQEAAADAAALRLKDGFTLLEALEDAELSFDYVAQFFRVRESLDVPPKALAHLDSDVRRMLEIAAGETPRALEFMKGRATYDAAASERLRREVERDRSALRIYRTDIGLSSQLPPAPAASPP
jgi:hypothetical protein